jgi:uncharacterized protein (DUF433 family)
MHIETPDTPGIISQPDIMFGKPVIAGTRITVELIMERIAAGQTIDDILASYPHLTRQQVLSALEHAARLVRAEAKCAIERVTGQKVED